MDPRLPHHGISASEADWSREVKPFWAWVPWKSLLGSIRSYQRHRGSKNPLRMAAKKVAVLRHLFWSVVTGADIPINCQIGGGLSMPHPNGIVIHPGSRIGPNCMIFQQVTIGMGHGGVPQIGGHVDIGAGAKVLGAIQVGDHARIGTNAVVTCDVPPNTTAVGIPARIVHPAQARP